MLNCRVSTGNVEGGGNAYMARLLDGSESLRRSLPETAVFNQSMKLHESTHRNARFAHLHVGAKRAIQHPLRNLNDLAGLNLYPDNCATGTILAAFMPKTPAEIWMPTIMKLWRAP